ncbi:uncharacterized protein LOC122503796 isoform X1 [Leptopilina heterotoma]|uniref:uncharacterized protein LOC122503796 isoform X1 n=1 Tax=Leptopilina heterotoma TaxID=63436 RepID=UPI001CA83FCD|nr:uncharacterized protein LOC122503796 isoform X1 [Leptopilina heterotoma]
MNNFRSVFILLVISITAGVNCLPTHVQEDIQRQIDSLRDDYEKRTQKFENLVLRHYNIKKQQFEREAEKFEIETAKFERKKAVFEEGNAEIMSLIHDLEQRINNAE